MMLQNNAAFTDCCDATLVPFPSLKNVTRVCPHPPAWPCLPDPACAQLSTPEAAKSVFFAERGTLAGVSPGKSVVDCATLDPATMSSFASAVSAKVKKNTRVLCLHTSTTVRTFAFPHPMSAHARTHIRTHVRTYAILFAQAHASAL
jgi:hypothetical protein